jgi:SAM-dependent methyltransferase
MSVERFYDDLAPLYHLIYEDWETAVGRWGEALAALITERWGPGARRVLDAAVGIGTQALGLAARGFQVTGSDLSPGAVQRARREAAARGFSLPCLVADFRALATRSQHFDVVVVADNALPHLESEAEIEAALVECFRCARPGGGCLVTMRDYGTPPAPGTAEVRPYGTRLWEGHRYHLQQVWTWRDAHYDLALEFRPVAGDDVEPIVLHTRYLAIPPARVVALMRAAGFTDAERVDGRFFQPVLMGTRPGGRIDSPRPGR